MNQAEKDNILEQMKDLKHTKLEAIGRLAATGNFYFYSADRTEFVLRVQTGFRFRDKEKILIGNLDMFEPTETIRESPGFDWDSFNWDVIGFNVYDEWAKQFKKEKQEELYVEKISVGDFGDLTIAFCKDIVLEFFLNSGDGECWRFFARGWEEHLVITPNGIEK
jgi:hypothetical protein